MDGPGIIARSLTRAKIEDQFNNEWQYHSQSDRHSKIACWALLFDLLQNCPLLLKHVTLAKVGFGINHEMLDFRTRRKKDLDLVLCTPGTAIERKSVTFSSLASEYDLDLLEEEREKLASLPLLPRISVGSVHVAIEAKAVMTEHVKALPRLYDELNSSHSAIHGSAEFTIAVGFAMVNASNSFISPGRNKFDRAKHDSIITRLKQPDVTVRTIGKLLEIPRRVQQNNEGFDALGIVVIDLQNDGSPVTIVTKPPAPKENDIDNYGQMIYRIASLYASKFADV